MPAGIKEIDMNANDISEISAWLTTQGLKGTDEMDIVNGFCQRARAAGMRLDRGLSLIDTLHPVYEGRAFQWDSKEPVKAAFEYGPTNEGVSAENWERSAFFHLREKNQSEIRRRLGFGDPADFYMLDVMLAAGHKDYIAMIHRFAQDSHIGDMDCFYSHWTTMDEEGFREEDLAALRQLVPVLALAVKAGSLTRISRTIAEVYLGEDAAKQVLEGRISRGKAERISAVLWFSDLQNYTRISDNLPPDEIIPFLNDYADAVISSIHEAGGNVLKLIGDGTLAIFKAEEREDACGRALLAEQNLRGKLKGTERIANARRAPRDRGLSRATYRRCLLWQYRLERPAGFHRYRSRRQRGQPHRLDVPLRRSQRHHVIAVRGRSTTATQFGSGLDRPLRAARRQAGPGIVYADAP
jgi:adenylate cyclase